MKVFIFTMVQCERIMIIMRLKDSMVMWKPDSSNIKVMSRDVYLAEVQDNNIRQSYRKLYPYWFSGRNSKYKGLSALKSKMMIYIEAIHIIVRDKVDPDAVHKEFLNIDEYVDGLADDMKR